MPLRLILRRDVVALQRPKSAYFFFMDDRRAELKAANPEMNVAQLGKLMGEEWNKIKESSAADKYKTQADADKARYTKEMAAYKK